MMRSGEQIEREISDWIEKSDEPKDKAMLLLLWRINGSLTENTVATKKISEDFTTHRVEVEEQQKRLDRIMNIGRGGYFVAFLAAAAIQAMAFYIIGQQIDALHAERVKNELQESRIITLEAKPGVTRNEFEDMRNRVFQLEILVPKK